MALLHGVLFFALKVCDHPKFGFIIQSVVFVLFEWIRTLGFLGFSYGVIGYSQYQIPCLIRTASVSGVWGISFVIYLFSALTADVIHSSKSVKDILSIVKKFKFRIAGTMCLIFILILTGSLKNAVNYSRTIKVALVQNNEDPWKDGIDEYELEADNLIKLTENAFEKDDNIQLVVWPETAIVPDILFSLNQEDGSRRKKLALKVTDYIASKKTGFVLGNNYNEITEADIKSFNSALYFNSDYTQNDQVEVYNKIHLVPFSEYFPFAKIFAPLYNKMVENGSQFWTPGKDIKIFECDGVRFSTPICFEDTFSKIPAQMKQAGSELIVNLSNDSWSHSLSCQNQHVAMAAFRSAENQIPSVRSTCSGQTCVIDAEGKIISELPPFSKGVLIFEVPIR